MSEVSTPIDVAFRAFEETANSVGTIRKEIIESLRANVNEMKVTSNDPARLIEVKMTMTNTLAGLLKDQMNDAKTRVDLSLKRQDSDHNGAVGKQVIALLHSIQVEDGKKGNGSVTPPNFDEAAQQLEVKFNECNIDLDGKLAISEKELEPCTGLPGGEPGNLDIPAPDKAEEEDED